MYVRPSPILFCLQWAIGLAKEQLDRAWENTVIVSWSENLIDLGILLEYLFPMVIRNIELAGVKLVDNGE